MRVRKRRDRGDTREEKGFPEAVILNELLIILLLVLLNGVFAGAEIAMLSIRRTRLNELLEERRAPAQAVMDLRRDPDRFLATVQIGITVVGATAAAFGGSSVAEDVAPVLARIPFLAPYAPQIAFAAVVGGVSALSLVLGELVPKSLALRAGEPYALLISRPLLALARLMTPLVWLLTEASNLVLRLFGDSTTFSETRWSREELQQVMDEAADAGSVAPEVGEIASRALAFDRLDASDLMVPGSNIVSVPAQLRMEDLARVLRTTGHARLPVYEGQRDNLVGVVNLREVFAVSLGQDAVDLRPLMHPLSFVPETMPAPALLRTMQAQRAHLAIVVDEGGEVRGLLTIEDLVEELVGEILSENEAPPQSIAWDANGSAVLAADLAVHEVNRDLGIDLPIGDHFSTLAGLAIDLADRIPQAGERFQVAGHVLEVVESSPRRVKTVRVLREAPSQGDNHTEEDEGGASTA